MADDDFDPRTATDNQILRNQAKREANRVADELVNLAEQIRCEAIRFDNESQPAAAVVADVVNAYTKGGYATSARFWSMVHDLSRMT